MSSRRSVAVVGATGLAGQQFVAALDGHPWFALARLVASERSAGKTYDQALRDSNGARRWWCDREPPANAVDLVVEDAAQFDASSVDLVFSAVESDAARVLEPRFAETTPVVSTASAFRYEDDVPVIIPGVNWSHVDLIAVQKKRRGWRGFVTPNPNCTTVGLVLALKPLADRFGVRRVILTSMQGISGAGRSPGVGAMDIVDNVVPFIPKEEEKVARETQKILGQLVEGGIAPADIVVSATCTRVPVLEGHTESVSVSLERPATPEDVTAALREFGDEEGLPTSPDRWIIVHDDPFRPQPRLDRDAERGMATSVGRIRPEPALENGIKLVLVSHNTKMGAASGAILVAEYLHQGGYLERSRAS